MSYDAFTTFSGTPSPKSRRQGDLPNTTSLSVQYLFICKYVILTEYLGQFEEVLC